MKSLKIFLPLLGLGLPVYSMAQDFNKNLFDKYCSKINNIYTNCDFKNINLYPYSNKQLEELKYQVNYSFDSCNFSQLNLEFFSEKDRFKISSGEKIIEITGQILNMRDSYFWDTNTNEYDSSCSFKINSVKASFSDYTKNKIKNYMNVIKEHKRFLEDVSGIDYSLGKLKLSLNALDKLNFSNQIQSVKLEIKNAKNIYSNDALLMFVLEDLEFELEYFDSMNPSLVNSHEIQKVKGDSINLINKALKSLNTESLRQTVQEYKANVTKILNNAESIPNFNKDEIQTYKNELNSL
jgi:hypothetical protein